MKKEVKNTNTKKKETVPQRTIDRFETGGEGIKVIKRPKAKK